MSRPRILIVDDEPSIRRVLAAHLRRDGYQVDAAEHGAQAIERLELQPYAMVVTDLQMPELGGLELLAWCRQELPELPVIIITAFGTVQSAVEALKLGAHDYITKPFDLTELRNVIGKALAHRGRKGEEPRRGSDGRFALVGRTPSMQQVYALIEKIAASPSTVLVQGESGTGKELVARALHDQSPRSSAPFIQVNCGAIPANLFESELFGHERGAFTGAVSAKPGRLELADGGTLFLDEISELPKEMQVKLLRAIQELTFERVGGVRTIRVDVRVVAATNVDLQAEVAAGRFREDLFYRLNVVPIDIPPLRERLGDMPLLVRHFLEKYNRRLGRSVASVSPATLEQLASWHWPGNVRELENVMERAVLLADADTLEPRDLHGVGSAAPTPELHAQGDQLDLKEYVRLHTARLERSRIQRALEHDAGNVTLAARRLGISRKSLQTKMKAYGLRDPQRSGEHGP